jgi:hypothetical protein
MTTVNQVSNTIEVMIAIPTNSVGLIDSINATLHDQEFIVTVADGTQVVGLWCK